MKSKRIAVLTLAAAVALGISCSDETTAPYTEYGTLKVYLDITGDTPDPDGCTVSVGGGSVQSLAAGDTAMFSDLPVGNYSVSLGDVEAFCTLNGANPRNATIMSDQTAYLRFEVTCGSAAPDSDIAGMEVLGSGYNVTGNYADVADVKAVVLDLASLDAANLLRQVQYERATYHVVSGENSHEYQRSLSAKVKITGSGFGFSGALKVSYKQDRYESQHYSFATVQSLIRKHGLRVALYVAPEELRSYLTQPAAAAINDASVDPFDLFEVFGTHVLTGVIVGGRLDFSTSANMSFEKQDRSIDVYARASFKNAFASASIEAQVTDDLSWSEYSASEEKHLEVYGGRSEYGQYIMNAGVYESWIESIAENSVFMDFESTGLLSVWELADDASRRTELEAAWNMYAEAHGITLQAAGSVRSNFEDDREGWMFYASGAYGTPTHHLQHGHFGAYIVGWETAGGEYLSFFAPGKFLGDKSMYAGGTLEYFLWYHKDLVGSWAGSIPYFVQIMSENGNLYYKPNSDGVIDPAFRPERWAPTQYVINLKAGYHDGADGSVPGQWYKVGGWDEATESDIWMALANVRAIQINGEFRVGEETVAFDRVSLNAPPSSP